MSRARPSLMLPPVIWPNVEGQLASLGRPHHPPSCRRVSDTADTLLPREKASRPTPRVHKGCARRVESAGPDRHDQRWPARKPVLAVDWMHSTRSIDRIITNRRSTECHVESPPKPGGQPMEGLGKCVRLPSASWPQHSSQSPRCRCLPDLRLLQKQRPQSARK